MQLLTDRLKASPKLLLDGSMGALMMAKGFNGPSIYGANFAHTDVVSGLHRSYFEAGADMVLTNTFSLTGHILSAIGKSAADTVKMAVEAAQIAREGFSGKYIALDLAPCDLSGNEAEQYYMERISAAAGLVDCIFFETYSDSGELKLAIQIARSICSLPVFASMTFNENMASWKGEMLGEAIASVAAERPDAIGINCTLSPSEMLGLIDSLIQAAGGIQTLCEPNRGMPEYIDGEAKYLLSAQDFASGVEAIYSKGVHIVGGCCGSDPECIRLISQRLF